MMMVRQRLKSTYRSLRTAGYVLKAVGLRDTKSVARFMASGLFSEYQDDRHLEAAMQWLCLAQDVCGGRGSANLYGLKTGWGVAYPETSGYIIATYLAYAEYSGDARYIERAIQIGDWEVEIQTPGGGVLSSEKVSDTRVFNTGQVILGWCALYEQTGDSKYLSAALRAGEYLAREQESDGTWRKDTHCGARTYHARSDWALLRLASLSGEQRFADVATKNLHWILQQQRANGWFDNCGFNDSLPITHVIAYTLRGLLESYLLSASCAGVLPGIVRAADALCAAIQEKPLRGIAGMVPTSFDENWQSVDDHSCLTGNAQLACFLFLLAHTIGNDCYRKTAEAVIYATKRTQNIDTPFPPVRGAIAGSYPLYKGYVSNGFPNWAAKFFADAIMMKLQFAQKRTIAA
jgi:Beta-L-arabinofuranosidase, GH127 catalytic domain